MKADFKPLTPEQFGLGKEELLELVTGAQTFLAPVADDTDSERLIPTVDQPEAKPKS